VSVYKKIQQVMQAVSYLQKDTKSQGYTAITHNKVTDAVREHCAKLGLIIIPQLKSEECVDIERQGKAPGVRYRCVYDFLIVDAESDTNISATVSAHADDYGDKAPGKALSYAMKSFMLKVFMIPSGDDDEQRVEFEKAKKERPKETMDDDRLSKAIEQIKANKYSVQKLFASFDLTEEQRAKVWQEAKG
jgi:hypothetical protein